MTAMKAIAKGQKPKLLPLRRNQGKIDGKRTKTIACSILPH